MDTRSPIPLRAAPPPAPSEPAVNIGDIYYIFFRHKWKIILCALAGIVTGTTFYFVHSPPYQSIAKLVVKYVVSDGGTRVGNLPGEMRKSPDMRGETIMDTEKEILLSFDLSKAVVNGVGAEKILAKAGGGRDSLAAASVVNRGLKANVPARSSIIDVTFVHPDAEMIQPVLTELIAKYFQRHEAIHSKPNMAAGYMSEQADLLRGKLRSAEDELQKARDKAKITSLVDAKAAVSRSISDIKEQTRRANADLVAKQAEFAVLSKRRSGTVAPTAPAPTNEAATAAGPAETSAANPAPAAAATTTEAPVPATTATAPIAPAPETPATTAVANANSQPAATAATPPEAPRAVSAEMPPPEVIEEYRLIAAKFSTFQQRELQLMSQFTDENQQVKDNRKQLEQARQQKRDLEKQYPWFVQVTLQAPTAAPGAPAAPATPTADLGQAEAEIFALKARVVELNRQLEAALTEQRMIDDNEMTILNAEREVQIFAKNYEAFRTSLEQEKIQDALSPGKVQNIEVIQAPPPPWVDHSKTNKTAGMAIAGGIAAGLAWALLIEMFLDRSVRRPGEFERSLGLQLFLSIPEDKKLRRNQRIKGKKKKRLSLKAGKDQPATPTGESELLVPMDEAEGLRPFHETLRDRLIGYFERRNLTHKPKLIAVTGIGSGSGVTTTTAGLARALSETGDGNVLVVDMTPGQGTALQFSRGQEVQGLESMLETRESTAPVQDNLYLVTESTNGDKLSRILPQRFSKLLPKLKSSDFDYIIFDMPPVSQISITPRLAEFMDMVLLVVESEKTDRETVQRAASLLAETKAHVGALLNKTRKYVPSWIQQEHMGNA